MILPCSVQNFKIIWQLSNNLKANEILRELSLRCVSEGSYIATAPLMYWENPLVPYHSTTWWRLQMEAFSAFLALCAGNSQPPVNSPHKGQWRGALMFSLIYALTHGWANNRDAGGLRRHRAHYDVTVMSMYYPYLHICYVLHDYVVAVFSGDTTNRATSRASISCLERWPLRKINGNVNLLSLAAPEVCTLNLGVLEHIQFWHSIL